MLYLFREVNLQGGFFFTFVLSSLDRELHSRIVRKCKKIYASCMYLYSRNPKCYCNVSYESCKSSECSRRDFFRFPKIMVGFLVIMLQTCLIL